MRGRKPFAVNNRGAPLHLHVPPRRRFLTPSLQASSGDYCFPLFSSGFALLGWDRSFDVKQFEAEGVNIHQRGEPCSACISITSVKALPAATWNPPGTFYQLHLSRCSAERLARNKTAVIADQKMPHLTQPTVTNTAVLLCLVAD